MTPHLPTLILGALASTALTFWVAYELGHHAGFARGWRSGVVTGRVRALDSDSDESFNPEPEEWTQ